MMLSLPLEVAARLLSVTVQVEAVRRLNLIPEEEMEIAAEDSD